MSGTDPATTSDPAVPDVTPRTSPSADPRLSDWVLATADRYRWWLLGGALLLYIAGFNGQWRLEPDSALYLSIGRNLVEGHGYTFHGKDHRLAYPGVPLMFAGLFKAFGTGTSGPGALLPHLIAMWLMGIGTLALVYRLFLLHAGRPTAVLMTFGVAISRVFYRYTFELLTDLPFVFGVMAFFVGYEAIFHRRSRHAIADANASEERQSTTPAIWLDGILLIAGLAIAVSTRPSMLALLLAAVLSAVWSLIRGRARWGHLLIAGIVILAVALFYVKDPRSDAGGDGSAVSTSYAEEDQLFTLKADGFVHYAKRAAGNAWEVFNGAAVKATFGLSVIPGVNVVLTLAVLTAGVMLIRTRPLWGMWVLATLAMVLVVPKPLDRYFLPTVPILVYAWWRCVLWVERRFTGRASRLAFLLLFGLGGICNLISTLDFVIQNRQSPFLMHYKEGRYASVYEVAAMIEKHTPASGSVADDRTTWVAVPDKFARILTFLSRRYCIEPDRYSALDPRRQNVYVLMPMEPKVRDPNDHRQPTAEWLASRGVAIVPTPLTTTPNKSPEDRRPFTLHDVMPAEASPATQPVGQP